jgi:hypothetical protein
MTYWLLTEKCTVISRSSVIGLRDYEIIDPIIIQKQKDFMQQIHDKNQSSSDFQEPFVVVELKKKTSCMRPQKWIVSHLRPMMNIFRLR